MANFDEAKSLIERALREAGDDQLQDLLVEAIDAIIALHEPRGTNSKIECRRNSTFCCRPDGRSRTLA